MPADLMKPSVNRFCDHVIRNPIWPPTASTKPFYILKRRT